MIVLTKRLIEAGATSGIGFNREQIEVLGLAFPPRHGWKEGLIGKTIPRHIYATFVKLKGVNKSVRQAILNGHDKIDERVLAEFTREYQEMKKLEQSVASFTNQLAKKRRRVEEVKNKLGHFGYREAMQRLQDI